LYDPDGNEVKSKEIFTDKEGTISESTFRIPSEAKIGVWKMKAVSGPNFVETEFSVIPSQEQGMSIEVTNIEKTSFATLVYISGFGAVGTVVIEITSSEGEMIDELRFSSKSSGEFSTIWSVPKDTPPGTYSIKAISLNESAETTLVLE